MSCDEIIILGFIDRSVIVFSNHTGGIRSIQLHKSDRLSKAYDLNHTQNPLLGIVLEDNAGNLIADGLPNPEWFKIVEENSQRIVFRWKSNTDLQIDRIYEGIPATVVFNHRTI